MPKCEFNPSAAGCGVACKTTEAIGTLLLGLEGAFTVAELRALLCNNEVAEAREQCPAYPSLAANGENSSWAK